MAWQEGKGRGERVPFQSTGSRAVRGGEGRERGSGSATSPPLVLKQPWRGARGVRKQSAAAAVVREGDNHGALKPPLTSSIAASHSPPLFLSFTSIVLFCFSASLIHIPASVLSCTACDCSVGFGPCLVSPLLPFTCHTSPRLCVCQLRESTRRTDSEIFKPFSSWGCCFPCICAHAHTHTPPHTCTQELISSSI